MAISKNSIKFIQSLRIKKFRQKYNKFIVEGDKMVGEILLQKDTAIDSLYATDSWIKTHDLVNKISDDKIVKISPGELERISTLKTPNQVLAILDIPGYEIDSVLIKTEINLFLDDIQDPGNLGTILRIADWFGIRQVICSPGTADVYNPKVIQSTMGAFLRVNTPVATLASIISANDQVPVFGAVMDGENIFKIDRKKEGLIVIGNEGKGISPENYPFLTKKISIPATAQSGAESLNAAVATGIICAFWKN